MNYFSLLIDRNFFVFFCMAWTSQLAHGLNSATHFETKGLHVLNVLAIKQIKKFVHRSL